MGIINFFQPDCPAFATLILAAPSQEHGRSPDLMRAGSGWDKRRDAEVPRERNGVSWYGSAGPSLRRAVRVPVCC